MPKKPAIPQTFTEFRDWHDLFLAGMQAVGASLGFTAPEIAQVGTYNTALHTKGDAQASAEVASKQATQERNDAWTTVDTRSRNFAKRAKLSGAYTEAIGAQLGIVGPEGGFNPATAKPTLKGVAQPDGIVELDFSKEGSDRVNLYCQRNGDSDFVFLARDTSSPYVDNRPLLVAAKPEVRRYRCRYILNDQEVGLPSDEVVVTAQPY